MPDEAVKLLYKLYQTSSGRGAKRKLKKFAASKYDMSPSSLEGIMYRRSRKSVTEGLDEEIAGAQPTCITDELLVTLFEPYESLRESSK